MKLAKVKSKATMCLGKSCNHERHHVDFTSGRVREHGIVSLCMMSAQLMAHKLNNHENRKKTTSYTTASSYYVMLIYPIRKRIQRRKQYNSV